MQKQSSLGQFSFLFSKFLYFMVYFLWEGVNFVLNYHPTNNKFFYLLYKEKITCMVDWLIG